MHAVLGVTGAIIYYRIARDSFLILRCFFEKNYREFNVQKVRFLPNVTFQTPLGIACEIRNNRCRTSGHRRMFVCSNVRKGGIDCVLRW